MRVWVGSLRVSGRAPLRLRPRFQTADPAREEDGEASSADFGSSEREDGAGAPGRAGCGGTRAGTRRLTDVSPCSRAHPEPRVPGERPQPSAAQAAQVPAEAANAAVAARAGLHQGYCAQAALGRGGRSRGRAGGFPPGADRLSPDQVFGCALATLCAREKSSVPYFVQQCVRAVEARGTRGSLGAGLGGQGGPQAGAWDLGGRVSASFSTGLDTDGLYRISGNLATIQKLRYHVDHSESPALSCRGRLQTHLQTRPRSAPP